MKAAYQLAVGAWSFTPSQFWRMHPTEFLWIMEAKTPVKMYGDMTEDEVAELYRETYGEFDG